MPTGDKMFFKFKFFPLILEISKSAFQWVCTFLPSNPHRQDKADVFSSSLTRLGQHLVKIVQQEMAVEWSVHCCCKQYTVWTLPSPDEYNTILKEVPT